MKLCLFSGHGVVNIGLQEQKLETVVLFDIPKLTSHPIVDLAVKVTLLLRPH